jgi:prevent-host-death family protein
MSRASVTELNANLSRYLQEVRRGGEVQILDRGVPVARLTGLPATAPDTADARRERLIRAGVLRPGDGGAAAVLDRPGLSLRSDVSAALAQEREDRV